MKAMSDAVGPGDLVLCVNAAPNHATGQPVPLVAGEPYRVWAVMDFDCPCGRSDALIDIGIDFAWCQSRFRLLPKPKAQIREREVLAPREKVRVRSGDLPRFPGEGRGPDRRAQCLGVGPCTDIPRQHRS